MSDRPQQTERQSQADGIQARVNELLGRMTSAEKAGQLTQYFYFRLPAGAAPDPALGMDLTPSPGPWRQHWAAVRSGRCCSSPTRPRSTGSAAGACRQPAWDPVLFGFDVIHGLRTIFPVPIAMAASWDVETIEQGQAVAAREARAVGIHWAFAPMVDIARDPRWGRIIEGAGEDPFLGATVAAAQVRGFQGTDYGQEDRIIAGPKHFAGYGAALGGRDYDEVNLSDAGAVEHVLAAVRGRRGGRRRQCDDRLHGSQRRPPRPAGGCSPRCCARRGASAGSWSATPTRSATWSPTASPRIWPTPPPGR